MDWKLEPIAPLVLAYKDGRFQRRGTDAEVRAETLAERAMVVVVATPGRTTAEIRRALRVKHNDVHTALQDLRKAGRVEVRTVERHGARGPAPQGWYPTAAEQEAAEKPKPVPSIKTGSGYEFPGADRRGPNGCQPDDAEEPKLVPTMETHSGYEFRFTSEPPDDSDDKEAF
jgi:hypothetical protein